jgi:hypothetical protein
MEEAFWKEQVFDHDAMTTGPGMGARRWVLILSKRAAKTKPAAAGFVRRVGNPRQAGQKRNPAVSLNSRGTKLMLPMRL